MTENRGFGLGLLDGLCPSVPITALEGMWCALAPWESPLLVLVLGLTAVGIFVLVRGRGPQGLDAPFVLPSQPEARGVVRRREPFPTGEGAPMWPASSNDAGDARVALGVAATPTVPPPAPGTVRYEQPPDGTLQLLPGRFEIQSGPGSGTEIRFVRIPGVEQEITFGRAEGPPHRHVQLGSPTVSRQHARLVFRDGHWTLRNESATNPTVHNGRPLNSGIDEVPLQDGDRVEMGEIRLIFHQSELRDRLASRSSWYTDRGRRSMNQDAVVVRTLPDGRELAAVCDGMGSHQAGGIASHVALDALMASLVTGSDLATAVHAANEAVYAAASGTPDQKGMGTTLVAILRTGEDYEIANVGDSRAYRVDDSGIHQLTRDHSFVSEMVDQGHMSYEEAIRSPWKNAVTRSLGAESEVEVDLFAGEAVAPPYLLVLCSDGVHGMLDPEEIERITRETPDVRDMARAVGERALVKGGEDNVAVAVLRVAGDPRKID